MVIARRKVLPLWLISAFGTLDDARAAGAASARPAEATFCVFDCSAGVKPTWPGRCVTPRKTYSTGGSRWLTLRTRNIPGSPSDCDDKSCPILPEWSAMSSGDMTWEGWFRVLAPPANGSRTSLIGTYGDNHDTQLYALHAHPPEDLASRPSRRRYGAVWIDPGGRLSVGTNIHRSTGDITGPNVVDSQWHHIAVAWQRTGGLQVRLSFKVMNTDLLRIVDITGLYAECDEIFRNRIADIAKVRAEDVFIDMRDESLRRVGGYFRFAVNATINPPLPRDNDLSDTLLRLRDRRQLTESLSDGIRGRIMQFPNNAYPIKPFLDTVIYADFVSFPVTTDAGSVHLYVDARRQPGNITYEPGIHDLSMDGQLVVGGGHLGRPLNAEVQRFRLWSRALVPDDLKTVMQCDLPDVSSLFGGPFPYSLEADYPLDGNFSNIGGTVFKSLFSAENPALLNIGEAGFALNSLCGYTSCPEASTDGCPLVKNRELLFDSLKSCESFARFNFCRRAGSQRGRPPYPYFDGCHAGGGDMIAEITL